MRVKTNFRLVHSEYHKAKAQKWNSYCEVLCYVPVYYSLTLCVCCSTKRTMERKYGLGAANELALFHGTSFKCVEAIQHQNIDPLLAGENVGTIWGKGAYFAIDAKISDNYASSDDDGYRYMFMARVLTGQIAQGARDLKRPPPLDSTMPNALADAVVDDMNNPRVYVVFRNQQIYPEFLIQYT